MDVAWLNAVMASFDAAAAAIWAVLVESRANEVASRAVFVAALASAVATATVPMARVRRSVAQAEQRKLCGRHPAPQPLLPQSPPGGQ